MCSPSSENLHDVAHIQGKIIPCMSVDSISIYLPVTTSLSLSMAHGEVEL